MALQESMVHDETLLHAVHCFKSVKLSRILKWLVAMDTELTQKPAKNVVFKKEQRNKSSEGPYLLQKTNVTSEKQFDAHDFGRKYLKNNQKPVS
jgi:hypothetical protein